MWCWSISQEPKISESAAAPLRADHQGGAQPFAASMSGARDLAAEIFGGGIAAGGAGGAAEMAAARVVGQTLLSVHEDPVPGRQTSSKWA